MCILKYGSILDRPRSFVCSIHSKIEELFNCSLCLGFWVGLFVGMCEYYIFNVDINYFYLPFISAGVCWSGDSLLMMIQTIEVYLDKKLEDME